MKKLLFPAGFKAIKRRYLKAFFAGLLVVIFFVAGGLFWLHRAMYHISKSDDQKIPLQTAVADAYFQREIDLSRRFIKKFMLENQSPSFSLALAWKGKLIWSEAFGYINPEQKIPATPDVRYRINSVSKPITGAALAKLYEAGLLSLDSSIWHYLPEFPRKSDLFTIRQLATHTAGIRHYRSDQEVLNTRHFNSVEQSLSVFAADSLLFRPGTQVKYSSFGYNLLGRVVEKISGRDYLEFIRGEILIPAGADGIGTENSDTSRVMYYERGEGLPLQVVPPIDQSIKYPSGGLVGTPQDMVAFGEAYWHGKIVAPESVSLFTTMQKLGNGAEIGFGLGWELSRTPAAWKRRLINACAALGFYLPQATGFYESVFHRGGASGSISGLVIYKKYDLVYAFTSNVNGKASGPAWKLPTLMMEQFMKRVTNAN